MLLPMQQVASPNSLYRFAAEEYFLLSCVVCCCPKADAVGGVDTAVLFDGDGRAVPEILLQQEISQGGVA